MKIFFTFFCLIFSSFLYSLSDVTEIVPPIQDINNPTPEEYRRIEAWLASQKPYDYLIPETAFTNPTIQQSCLVKLNRFRSLKLVGPNQEMPVFEKYVVNTEENAKDRCIIIYCSYNGIYPEKARRLVSELFLSGYHGHILLRIGGYPNTSHGGLKLCHIPYAFKVAFFREAMLLGYKAVLWLDTAMHPLTNLDYIFDKIQEHGYFFIYPCSLQDNLPFHLTSAAEALGVTPAMYEHIPHIATGVLGFNMENKKALQVLDGWEKETLRWYPCLTCFPEELSLSVLAWRLECRPLAWFWNILCLDRDPVDPLSWPTIQLYLDSIR